VTNTTEIVLVQKISESMTLALQCQSRNAVGLRGKKCRRKGIKNPENSLRKTALTGRNTNLVPRKNEGNN
jgi:hypothetical protein